MEIILVAVVCGSGSSEGVGAVEIVNAKQFASGGMN